MRVLALDYGKARCGVAVSDPSGTLAQPLDPIERPDSEDGFGAVVRLVNELGVERIVVGMPIGLSGKRGPQAQETEGYIARLGAHVRVPVVTLDERFTTRIAQQTMSHAKQAGAPTQAAEDSIAAAHLLSGFLESATAEP